MTTPGGVPNLPQGALTIDSLATNIEDLSGRAMRDRAAERFPAIMGGSSGGNPMSNLTPFGILTRIWAEFNSGVANADPADIQGPDDLPVLLLKFIEGLPVVGDIARVVEAITGTYKGNDVSLKHLQELFAFLRPDGRIDASKLFDLEAVIKRIFPALAPIIDGAKSALDVNGDGSVNFADVAAVFTGGKQAKSLVSQLENAASSGTGGGTGIGIVDGALSALNGLFNRAVNADSKAGAAQTTANSAASAASSANSAAGAASTLADNVRQVVAAASGTASNPVSGLQALFDAVRGVRTTAAQGVSDAGAASAAAGNADAKAQGILDKAVAALGGSGTGKTATDLQNALAAIPGGNIVGSLAAGLVNGVLSAANIPSLDAGKIGSGTLGAGRIPDLDAAKIVSGALDALRIPNLDAGKITGGTLGAARIPGLPASQITSGTFADALVPGLAARTVQTDFQNLIDKAWQALTGGTATGKSAADVNTALKAIPGGNIGSAIAAANVPNLDAGKVTTGTFGTSLIPALDAGKITSGTFGTGLIPNLDAGKIVSGLFGAARIPSLPASQITTGTFADSFVPSLSSIAQNIKAALTKDISGVQPAGTGDVATVLKSVNDVYSLANQANQAAVNSANQQAAEQQPTNTGMKWSTSFAGGDGAALSTGDWTTNDIVTRGDYGYASIKAGLGDGLYYAVTVQQFTTDIQQAYVVWGAADSSYGKNWASGVAVHCNSGRTAGAYMLVTASNISIGKIGSSAWTSLNRTNAVGDNVRFRSDGAENYSVSVNGTTVLSYTNTGTAVSKGSGYRYAALVEQRGTANFGFWYGDVQADSYRISSFGMADWVSAAAGVTTPSWRLRKGAAGYTALAVTAGSSAALPASFLNSQDLAVGCTITTLGTGRVTITTAGWYELQMTCSALIASAVSGAENNSTSASTAAVWASSGNNGGGTESASDKQVTGQWGLSLNSTVCLGPLQSGATATVYLAVNDVVAPVIFANQVTMTANIANRTLTGSAAYGKAAITAIGGPSAAFTGRLVATS